MPKTAIIIGAGPAGLTAAYELLTKTDIKPIIYESSADIGGISKTLNYKGNRIDIGGHRFFSKSDRIIEWWQNILPLEAVPPKPGPDPEREDKLMLMRKRLSRIFFLRKFFAYPVSLSLETLSNLGIARAVNFFLSYIKVRLMPIREEKSLEDFFVNRFGKELYGTFFKDYTEKVWGLPCSKIKAEWGEQRVKGLSIAKTIYHAFKKMLIKRSPLDQKNIETSLIEYFLYPKFGPGQMWEEAAKIIKEKGGEIHLNHHVVGLDLQKNEITEAEIKVLNSNEIKVQKADYFFSTMPIKELIPALGENAPGGVKRVAQGLMYRDFITVGLLLKKLKIKNDTKIKTVNDFIPDNWIYIQERDVKVCRVQIFNNWSPYLVKEKDKVWIGLEYVCSSEDEIWGKTDKEVSEFAIGELLKIGFIEKEDIIDWAVIRMEKVYPTYSGAYEEFETVKNFCDRIENLFLIGRNGMHRYNNQDHSMLTAMVAVENIINNLKSKKNIWEVNIEKSYHESK
ncbi:MAG: NAD(P)/FAD-dependent oxidoreductase [bacterium]|nr:NAD(P)/FAD-dependent oxidoreductase [bacterium]